MAGEMHGDDALAYITVLTSAQMPQHTEYVSGGVLRGNNDYAIWTEVPEESTQKQ